MIPPQVPVEIVSFFAYLLPILAAVAGLAWWLSGQFSNLRGLIFSQIEKLDQKISDKLEYHERHDDQRFIDMRNDIWDIRVRNAARDGVNPLIRNVTREEIFDQKADAPRRRPHNPQKIS